MSTWHDHAACRGADTSLFFDEDDDRMRTAAVIDMWCATCPVAVECLAADLKRGWNHQHGIAGGMTSAARRRLLRMTRSRACEDCGDDLPPNAQHPTVRCPPCQVEQVRRSKRESDRRRAADGRKKPDPRRHRSWAQRKAAAVRNRNRLREATG